MCQEGQVSCDPATVQYVEVKLLCGELSCGVKYAISNDIGGEIGETVEATPIEIEAPDVLFTNPTRPTPKFEVTGS